MDVQSDAQSVHSSLEVVSDKESSDSSEPSDVGSEGACKVDSMLDLRDNELSPASAFSDPCHCQDRGFPPLPAELVSLHPSSFEEDITVLAETVFRGAWGRFPLLPHLTLSLLLR